MLRIFASMTVCLLAFASNGQSYREEVSAPSILPLALEITTSKYVFPGHEFEMYFSYRDAQNLLVSHFSLNHEKLNHTIIVSEDLETFSHIHPDLQKNGQFMVPINTPKELHPDNNDAAFAISKPGTYLVFSEVVPTEANEVTLVRGMLSAHGKENFVALTPDVFSKNKAIKYFKSNGDVGTNGDTYRVTLTVEKMAGMIHFNFKVEEWHISMKHYMVASNLENWLGMPGHGILISEAGDDVYSKEFRHLHAMAGDDPHAGGHNHHRDGGGHDHAPSPSTSAISGENLQMMVSGADVPPSGTYKLWGQFKHNGKVVTFPFVLTL